MGPGEFILQAGFGFDEEVEADGRMSPATGKKSARDETSLNGERNLTQRSISEPRRNLSFLSSAR